MSQVSSNFPYSILEQIGEGTFGIVYKAWDEKENKDIALKMMRMEWCVEGVPSTILREISLLKNLCHPNIIRLYQVVHSNGRLYLALEYLNMDLKDFIEWSSGPLPPPLIKSYTFQMLNALHYCHTHRIIHRDVKPSNLLLDSAGHIKLADFGLARAFRLPIRALTHEVVTLWYRAPEILLGCKIYTMGVDVWSVGCIFAEMFRKKVLFEGDSEISQVFQIFKTLGTPNEDTWPGVTSLLNESSSVFPPWKPQDFCDLLPNVDRGAISALNKMLIYDPSQRMSAKDILNDPYFMDVTEVEASQIEEAIRKKGEYQKGRRRFSGRNIHVSTLFKSTQ